MSLARTALLKISDSQWMREHGVKAPFVRRAVATFMPGETAADMLNAATAQAAEGVGAVFTRLGENVLDMAEAQRVTDHYLERDRGGARAAAGVRAVDQAHAARSRRRSGSRVRQRPRHRPGGRPGRQLLLGGHGTVPLRRRTLDVVRRLRARVPRIGVALQAYLHRTSDDAASMIARGIGIRLVKGAYSEPPSVAFPKKADVDANYVKLARLMMSPGARASGSRAVFGTHDTAIIKAIEQHGDGQGLAPTDYEVHMLYGIQRGEQRRLARDRKTYGCSSPTAPTGSPGTCGGWPSGRPTSGSWPRASSARGFQTLRAATRRRSRRPVDAKPRARWGSPVPARDQPRVHLVHSGGAPQRRHVRRADPAAGDDADRALRATHERRNDRRALHRGGRASGGQDALHPQLHQRVE